MRKKVKEKRLRDERHYQLLLYLDVITLYKYKYGFTNDLSGLNMVLPKTSLV